MFLVLTPIVFLFKSSPELVVVGGWMWWWRCGGCGGGGGGRLKMKLGYIYEIK